MPSDFPRSPKLIKGALVVFETKLPVPTNLIVFQYNPETMSRGFQIAAGASDPRLGSGGTGTMLPPIETFQVAVELDAADQLEDKNVLARGVGLHPREAMLHFNLACYEAQLGQLDDARAFLDTACGLNPEFKELAKTDPDLAPLR